MRVGQRDGRGAPRFLRRFPEGSAWAAILLIAVVILSAVPVGPISPPFTPKSRTQTAIGSESPSSTESTSTPAGNGSAYRWQTLNSSPQLPNNTLWSAGYDPALGKIVALSEGQYDYSPTQDVSTLFQNCSFTPTNTTWTFSGGRWTELPIAGPSPGLFRSLAYDPNSGNLIEFQATGGLLPNTSSAVTCLMLGPFSSVTPGLLPPSSEFYSGVLPNQDPETWEFQGHNWTRISTPTPLNAVTNLVYDPALSAVVMFTTINNVSNKLDLWEFDSGSWTNMGATAFPTREINPYFTFSNALPNASWHFNASCLSSQLSSFNRCFVAKYPGVPFSPPQVSNLIYDPQLRELVWLFEYDPAPNAPNDWAVGFNGTWHLIPNATAGDYMLLDSAYDPAVPGLVGEPCLTAQAEYSLPVSEFGYEGCWNGTGVYSNGALRLLNVSPPAPLPSVLIPRAQYGAPQDGNLLYFLGSWYLPTETAQMVFDPRDGYLVMFGATLLVPDWTDYTYTYTVSGQTYLFGPTAQLQISVSVSPSTICSSVSNACGTAQTAAQVSVSLALLPLNANAPLPTPRTDFVAYGPLFWVPAPQLSYLPGPNIRLVPSAAVTSLCANLSGPVSPCPSAPRIESNGSGPPLYLWYWGNGSPPLEVGSTWTVTFTITSTLAANATLPIDRCASAYCGPSDGPQDGQLSGVASRPGSDAGSIPYSWPISLLDVLDPNATHPQPPPNPGPTTVPPSPPPPPIPTSPVSLPAPPTLLPSLIGSVAPGLSYIALAAGVMAAGFTRGRLRQPTPQRALAMPLRSGKIRPRASRRDEGPAEGS